MYNAEWMFEQLGLIKKHLWNINLDNSVFSRLKTEISELSAVHHTLESTVRQLHESGASTLTNPQNRIEKFLEALFGASHQPSSANKPRWERLRSMDHETFLLIAASYTPLDVTKMPQTEFRFLIENASEYLHMKPLSPRWMFAREVQMAVAAKAELAGMEQFKRSLY